MPVSMRSCKSKSEKLQKRKMGWKIKFHRDQAGTVICSGISVYKSGGKAEESVEPKTLEVVYEINRIDRN